MKQWTVGDVMSRDVATATPRSLYREIVDLLVERGVSAVPIVDEAKGVIGVVSEADFLHKVEDRAPHQRRDLAVVGAQLMTSPVVTVRPETSIAAAARRLEANHIKWMPVVDERERLVGVVSRRDLLRQHIRPDCDIRADIVDGILVGALLIDPLSVEVDVVDGVVTMTGKVESRGAAVLLVELVGEVAGVVTVVDRLAWYRDDPPRRFSHGDALAPRLLSASPR